MLKMERTRRSCLVRPLQTARFALLVALVACKPPAAPARDFSDERARMVQEQILMRGVSDERLLAAMRKVPREQFVPEPIRELSYSDQPLPIGEEQTISQPFIVAFMTDKLRIKPGERVLEIGTGSGYQAAIFAEMGAKVYTVEIVESLGKRAAATLQRLGYKDIHVKIGDGYRGWPEYAPFDAVIVDLRAGESAAAARRADERGRPDYHPDRPA